MWNMEQLGCNPTLRDRHEFDSPTFCALKSHFKFQTPNSKTWLHIIVEVHWSCQVNFSLWNNSLSQEKNAWWAVTVYWLSLSLSLPLKVLLNKHFQWSQTQYYHKSGWTTTPATTRLCPEEYKPMMRHAQDQD